jgi:S-adenosylmethionine-diacylglycerol 3-amino-3-carboxypropyl transferase
MKNMSPPLSKINSKLFQNIHTNNLIYNTCWEDPQCDRQMLNLKSDSRLVMITSAGCNALDYALDMPQKIHWWI